MDTDGNLTFTKTDNTTFGPFMVKGSQGSQGPQGPVGPIGPTGSSGIGISTASIDNIGNLTFTKTDNTTFGPFMARGPQGLTGQQGPQGPTGQQGLPGIGISSANMDTAGNLIFNKTDNTTFGPFMVKGQQGPAGPTGPTGPAGNMNTPENIAFLQGKTLWCADGQICNVPTNTLSVISNTSGSAIGFGQNANKMPMTGSLQNSGIGGDDNTLSVFAPTRLNMLSGKSSISITNTGGFSHVPPGTIMMYAGKNIPDGFLNCDGRAVSRSIYSDLYNVIQIQYGPGDGSTTFNLPDLRGRSSLGSGQGPNLTNRILGTSGGVENHVLTIDEMPSHSHNISVPQGDQNWGNGGGNSFWGNNWGRTITSTSVGSGKAHNNMHPFLVINFIIKT
jgi:microcystin-dependent protein